MKFLNDFFVGVVVCHTMEILGSKQIRPEEHLEQMGRLAPPPVRIWEQIENFVKYELSYDDGNCETDLLKPAFFCQDEILSLLYGTPICDGLNNDPVNIVWYTLKYQFYPHVDICLPPSLCRYVIWLLNSQFTVFPHKFPKPSNCFSLSFVNKNPNPPPKKIPIFHPPTTIQPIQPSQPCELRY